MTKTGWTTGAVGVVLVVVGAVARYPEVVACGVACLAGLGCAVLMVRFRTQVTVSRQVSPSRVTEGAASRAFLTVTNTGRRRSLPLVAREHFDGRQVLVQVPSLAPGAAYRTSYPLAASGRGVYPVGPLTIARQDPLRMLSVPHSQVGASTLWVHPRVSPLNPAPSGRSHANDGPTYERSPRGGVVFHSLRKYETGNDLRLVHWKASARAGTLMVRNNIIPNEPWLTVVLDTNADGYTGPAFDEAVRIAASLCVSACDGGVPAVVHTTGGHTVRAERPGRQRAGLLDLLAAVGTSSEDRDLAWLTGLVPPQPGLSLVVVSGQPAPGRLRAVSMVRHRYQSVTLVRVGDPAANARSVPGAVDMPVASCADFVSAWTRSAAALAAGRP